MRAGQFIGAATLALLLAASPAAAADDARDTRDLVNAAYAAVNRGDADVAVNLVGRVIANHEASIEPGATYTCASGVGDTLAALIGAAAANEKGNGTGGKTVAISSDICDAYFLKGYALIDLKRQTEALPFLEKAVALDPDNGQYINELAEWHKVARDWDTSLALFTRASETTDLSLAMMDDKAQADKIDKQRKCRAFRGIAFNHSELRNWDKARAAIGQCLKLIPDDQKSQVELEYIRQQSGG